jgi:flagellar biosynthesis/type III secretory pathway chaperone
MMDDDPVLDALERQVGCYRLLAKLADQQHEHVRQSRTEELLAVLSQRQQVLDQVAELEQAILPAKRRWGDYLNGLADERRTSAQEMMAESRRLLEKITASDKSDAMVLQQRKIEVGRTLRHNAAARNVSRSYQAASLGRGAARVDIQR